MPTYDYRCDNCGHEFERFESITANPAKKCPECGKMKLRRLIGTGAGVIFKGSGFYETDYRSDSYKKAADGDKPKSESAASKDSSKKDTAKSETPKKTESKPASEAKGDSKKSA